MIDIHSHILPGVDDGPKRIEESITMLEEAKNSGFSSIVCTTHYGIFENENNVISQQKLLIEKLNNYGISLYIRK